MTYLLIGCLAFLFLFLFDINKTKLRNRNLNISFAIGIALLAGSTIGIIIEDYGTLQMPDISRLLAGLITIISFLLMVYSLFFALPFEKTYTDVKNTYLIDTGMYALCRHPGVIWFFFFYLFLWITSGKMMMLWAGIIWTTLDVIHVYIQDRWFFPQTLVGYEIYKNNVPFLIPNRISIRKCLSAYGIRNLDGLKNIVE